jgi:hypothetical protein
VKLDLRRAHRGRRGANLVQEEVVPLYTHSGLAITGGLSRHDVALVVAVPRTPRVMCLVLTLSGRLLALHRMQFAEGMVEFLGQEVKVH